MNYYEYQKKQAGKDFQKRKDAINLFWDTVDVMTFRQRCKVVLKIFRRPYPKSKQRAAVKFVRTHLTAEQ